MKIFLRIALFLVLGFIASSWVPFNPSTKLVKAFEALDIYNYFAAKDLFYKSMKKDTLAASYGLSVIYGRNDNPFHNLDSAFKFIEQSKSQLPNTGAEKWEDLAAVGVASSTVYQQVSFVDSCFYSLALRDSSVEHWNTFISNHFSEPYHRDAILHRDKLAFALAETLNSSSAYMEFMQTYPEAEQYALASEKYELRLYEESVTPGSPASYRSFISSYPESPYRKEAELEVYQLSTEEGTVQAYLNFIEKNPSNPCVNKAWRYVYSLEISELTPASLAAFSMDYPDYPFMEEVKAEFEAVTTRYYPIEQNGKWGFIDEQGQLKIEAVYDWVEPFSENMAVVGSGDEVRFINKEGELVIDLALEDAYSFKMGYVVAVKGGKYGVLNRLGEWIIPPEYAEIGEYSEGYFYAAKENLFGYLNQQGEVIIPFKYLNATDFKNGGAVVENAEGMGVIDVSDKPITTFGFNWIEPFQPSGAPSRFRLDNKFGLLSQKGKILAEAKYERIGDWSDSLALAAADGKYGFINLNADTVVDFKYTFKSAAYEQSRFLGAYAKVFQKDMVGVIDTSGAKVFPAIFQDIGKFEGGLIAVKKRGKWGYADREVNLAISYGFDEAQDFQDSIAVVKVKENYGLIDNKGGYIITPTYASLELLDACIVVSDTAYGIVDLTGTEVVPQEYQKFEQLDQKVIKLKRLDGGVDYYDFVRRSFIWKTNEAGTSKE